MSEILYDSSKFEKVHWKPGEEITFLLQKEDKLTKFLKKLKRSISGQLYTKLYPRGL